MPAQAPETAAPIQPEAATPQATPHPIMAAITDEKARAAVELHNGIPVMNVRELRPYSDTPFTECAQFQVPVADIYAPRDILKEIYTPDVLDSIARLAPYTESIVKCNGCNIASIKLGGTLRFLSYEDEVPPRARKYFPHSMNGGNSRNGTQHLCTECVNAGGMVFCRHCGIVCKPHARTQSCEECYKVHAVRNRRSRDNFQSFRRANAAWTDTDADGKKENIFYGIELEYSDIEGQKRLSEFLKTDAFPLHSKELAVKGDGSVSHGFEINAGKGTYEQITADIGNICKAMQFFPHTGNRAGYHIHASFDIEDRHAREDLYYRVASLYSAIEPLLFAAVPAWRQENSFAGRAFPSFRAPEQIKGNYSTERYRALNMTAMSKYGTLEWRLFPSSSRPEMLTGYLSVIQWLMATVWERREEKEDQWSKRHGKMESAREYLAEAFVNEDSPNFRFMSRALASLSIPPAVMDFLVERIGYNIVQKIKYEKESAQKSVFTDRDRSLPSYSYEIDRNTKTMAALKNAFKTATA